MSMLKIFTKQFGLQAHRYAILRVAIVALRTELMLEELSSNRRLVCVANAAKHSFSIRSRR